MDKNMKNWLLTFINVFLVISTIIIVIIGVTSGAGEGQVGENMSGSGYFKAFTTDSNILMGIIAGIMLFFNIKNLIKKQDNIPMFATILYLIGASAVALTFLTVLVFLAPLQAIMGNGYFYFFSGQMFFFHFANPVLAMLAFMFLINQNKISIKKVWFGIIPTLLYSIVYVMNVAILKTWSDFYGFTFGGKMYLAPIVIIVMYGVSFALALLLAMVHNKRMEKLKE